MLYGKGVKPSTAPGVGASCQIIPEEADRMKDFPDRRLDRGGVRRPRRREGPEGGPHLQPKGDVRPIGGMYRQEGKAES